MGRLTTDGLDALLVKKIRELLWVSLVIQTASDNTED